MLHWTLVDPCDHGNEPLFSLRGHGVRIFCFILKVCIELGNFANPKGKTRWNSMSNYYFHIFILNPFILLSHSLLSPLQWCIRLHFYPTVSTVSNMLCLLCKYVKTTVTWEWHIYTDIHIFYVYRLVVSQQFATDNTDLRKTHKSECFVCMFFSIAFDVLEARNAVQHNNLLFQIVSVSNLSETSCSNWTKKSGDIRSKCIIVFFWVKTLQSCRMLVGESHFWRTCCIHLQHRRSWWWSVHLK